MEVFQIGDIEIILNKKGADEYLKVSYPLRYGHFDEIKTPGHIFQFNLNGEIKFVSGRGKLWPYPSEWLKRTVANDWVYYSTGGYSGVYDAFGEYYLPCFSYPSNAIHLIDPFKDTAVKEAIKGWLQFHDQLSRLPSLVTSHAVKRFLGRVQRQSPRNLEARAEKFHRILGDRVTVLPPDTRHVDYEIIPIMIADGCLYQCDFCRIKSGRRFELRTKNNIVSQLQSLKAFYGRDILNYNSIFLGQHDALNAGTEPVIFAAKHAFDILELDRSLMKNPRLFFFGSVDSFISADRELFNQLADLPFQTYINIGLESTDEETLAYLKKAISLQRIETAFDKIIEINKTYENIEITANILFDGSLPHNHLPSFFRLIEKKIDRFLPKGTIYFSPLMGMDIGKKKEIKREFYKVKIRNRLPSFLYLIQRL